jgi:hypothetical protein
MERPKCPFVLFDEPSTSPYVQPSLNFAHQSYFSIALLPGQPAVLLVHARIASTHFPVDFDPIQVGAAQPIYPKYQKFGGLQGRSCTLKDIHSPDHDLS